LLKKVLFRALFDEQHGTLAAVLLFLPTPLCPKAAAGRGKKILAQCRVIIIQQVVPVLALFITYLRVTFAFSYCCFNSSSSGHNSQASFACCTAA